jgi:hypothetical protein
MPDEQSGQRLRCEEDQHAVESLSTTMEFMTSMAGTSLDRWPSGQSRADGLFCPLISRVGPPAGQRLRIDNLSGSVEGHDHLFRDTHLQDYHQ